MWQDCHSETMKFVKTVLKWNINMSLWTKDVDSLSTSLDVIVGDQTTWERTKHQGLAPATLLHVRPEKLLSLSEHLQCRQ